MRKPTKFYEHRGVGADVAYMTEPRYPFSRVAIWGKQFKMRTRTKRRGFDHSLR